MVHSKQLVKLGLGVIQVVALMLNLLQSITLSTTQALKS